MKLSSIALFTAVIASAQGPKMIVWAPGMDHAYQDGVLWLKADAPDRASLAVSVSANAQFVSVQIALTNHSAAGIDVLPDRFSLTLSQPQSLALSNVPDHAVAGQLRATTVTPGKDLRGTVYFKQDRVCTRGGCQGLLTVPLGETIFVFPVTLDGQTPAPMARAVAPAAARTPEPREKPAPPPKPQPAAVPAPGPVMSVSRPALPVKNSKQRDWQTGLILDYAQSRTVYTTGSTTSAHTDGKISSGNGSSKVDLDTTETTTVHHVAVKTTDLFIVGDHYVYEVQDSTRRGDTWLGIGVELLMNRKHGCRFVIGEKITYAQEKGHLYVIDPDGKECKAEVVRQERLK